MILEFEEEQQLIVNALLFAAYLSSEQPDIMKNEAQKESTGRRQGLSILRFANGTLGYGMLRNVIGSKERSLLSIQKT